MADKPIIFSAPMVRALLEGRKTQTRRLLNRARVFATPGQPAFTLKGDDLARALQNADRFRHLDGDGWFWEADAYEWQAPHTRTGWMAHIGYAPGDRLWVRENWKPSSIYSTMKPRWVPRSKVFYAADDGYAPSNTPWKPSIHMPRWASRLTLTVQSVKVERLQEISWADAIAEGVVDRGRQDGAPYPHCYVPGIPRMMEHDATVVFASLWEDLHGDGAWAANPFVVAISFAVAHRNIDREAA